MIYYSFNDWTATIHARFTKIGRFVFMIIFRKYVLIVLIDIYYFSLKSKYIRTYFRKWFMYRSRQNYWYIIGSLKTLFEYPHPSFSNHTKSLKRNFFSQFWMHHWILHGKMHFYIEFYPLIYWQLTGYSLERIETGFGVFEEYYSP